MLSASSDTRIAWSVTSRKYGTSASPRAPAAPGAGRAPGASACEATQPHHLALDQEDPLLDLRPVDRGSSAKTSPPDRRRVLELLDHLEVAVDDLVEQHVDGEPARVARQQLGLALPPLDDLVDREGIGAIAQCPQEPLAHHGVHLVFGQVVAVQRERPAS